MTRRVVCAAALLLLAALVPGVSSPATADDSSTLTVVGTSDVFDSNLVQSVLKPGFKAAYPQFTLNYVSKGTGAAIDYAEAGTASALLVHAASLENQFVADGYSAEKYGRAIFWGDYVLLGPASDPAGVLNGDTHDIVGAFEKIAAAGAGGQANFVSRGGTPGTTVQEHQIWALTQGVTTCTVSDPNGGGTSPSTQTGACPTNIPYPSWYHATGLTQGPNIENGDVCNYPSNNNNCYVFTDRGTFQYLENTGAISHLQIVTRDNQVPGQQNLLVNSFHAYAVSPRNFKGQPVQLNTVAAKDFLNWVTSPEAQFAVQAYLNGSGDGPFRPSASPSITSSALPPSNVTGGKSVFLRGKIANVVPGTPPLNGVPVRVQVTQGGQTSQVRRVLTNAKGGFAFHFIPPRTGTYSLATGTIYKIEQPLLTPVFGDRLAPASLTLGRLHVQGVVNVRRVTSSAHRVAVRGKVLPTVTGSAARLELWAAHPGHALRLVAHRTLTIGTSSFDKTFHLGSGRWQFRLAYAHSGVVSRGTSALQHVRLP